MFSDNPIESPKSRNINNHIKSIEVYNGDDSYHATAGIKLSPQGYEGILMETQDIKGFHTDYRMRGELGLIVNLESEDGEEWQLGITHHKGCVYVEQLKRCPYNRPTEKPINDFDATKWLNPNSDNTLQP